jgi:hypothetical protein
MDEIRKLASIIKQGIATHTKVKREPLYSASDIASLTGLTSDMVNYRIKKLGLVPDSKTQSLSEVKLKGKKLYKGEVIALIKGYLGD